MKRTDAERSVTQRVANEGRVRKLQREDALTAYAMDRFLVRLARSAEAKSFLLKGGLLVANLVDTPFRFTRDIDLLRRRGPSDPNDIRERLQRVASLSADDPLTFGNVRAVPAVHDVDGYDGVRVRVAATLGNRTVDVQIDIGFGDAVRPRAVRRTLAPFLDTDVGAKLLSYPVEAVVAEKTQTLFYRVPLIQHRLKDLLDIVVLARRTPFRGKSLGDAMRATAERRNTSRSQREVDEFAGQVSGRAFESGWADLGRQKAVRDQPELRVAVAEFIAFVERPWMSEPGTMAALKWVPCGPWTEE